MAGLLRTADIQLLLCKPTIITTGSNSAVIVKADLRFQKLNTVLAPELEFDNKQILMMDAWLVGRAMGPINCNKVYKY